MRKMVTDRVMFFMSAERRAKGFMRGPIGCLCRRELFFPRASGNLHEIIFVKQDKKAGQSLKHSDLPCSIGLLWQRSDVRKTLVAHIGDQCQMTGLLDGNGKIALVFGTGAGNTPGHYLRAIADVFAQAGKVFVVDIADTIHAKTAYLAPAAPRAAASAWGVAAIPVSISVSVSSVVGHCFLLLGNREPADAVPAKFKN